MTQQDEGGAENAPARRGGGYWATIMLGAVIMGIGLPILAGGVWMIVAGSTWYYGIIGAGLMVSGLLLIKTSIVGLWTYLLTYAGTVIWSLLDQGMASLRDEPGLIAVSILMLLVLLTIPVLRGYKPRTSRGPGLRIKTANA